MYIVDRTIASRMDTSEGGNHTTTSIHEIHKLEDKLITAFPQSL